MVVHCVHAQRTSIFYQFMNTLNNYIAHRHEEDKDFPSNRTDLEGALACRFVFTKGTPLDEDHQNLYKPWRIAIYCGGQPESVKDLLMFVDAFVYWVATVQDTTRKDFETVPKIDNQVPRTMTRT